MNTTIKDEIRAENVHLSNEINARNLETYHSMLNSFNMQATLIVGFALNSINAEQLQSLANDDSRYCIYTSGRAFWGYIFGSSTVACISISLTCIAASFYMTIRSQEYALHVGVREAVAMVRCWARTIIYLYLFGLICFFLAALSIVWIFTGGENWRTLDEQTYAHLVDNVSVVRLDDGGLKGTCLQPQFRSSHEEQLIHSRLFASITTATFVLTLTLGLCFLMRMRADFDTVERTVVQIQGAARLDAVVEAVGTRPFREVAIESERENSRSRAAAAEAAPASARTPERSEMPLFIGKNRRQTIALAMQARQSNYAGAPAAAATKQRAATEGRSRGSPSRARGVVRAVANAVARSSSSRSDKGTRVVRVVG